MSERNMSDAPFGRINAREINGYSDTFRDVFKSCGKVSARSLATDGDGDVPIHRMESSLRSPGTTERPMGTTSNRQTRTAKVADFMVFNLAPSDRLRVVLLL
jgi:hypothetical protein